MQHEEARGRIFEIEYHPTRRDHISKVDGSEDQTFKLAYHDTFDKGPSTCSSLTLAFVLVKKFAQPGENQYMKQHMVELKMEGGETVARLPWN